MLVLKWPVGVICNLVLGIKEDVLGEVGGGGILRAEG